jgi:hypothetical protein
MHVYTMGTRAYAEEVCAAIDPDGKAFGGRVLSRDESGSESSTWSCVLVFGAKVPSRPYPEKSAKTLPLRYFDGGHHR